MCRVLIFYPVYLNALLATLNTRPALRQHVAGDLISISVPLEMNVGNSITRTVETTVEGATLQHSVNTQTKEVRYIPVYPPSRIIDMDTRGRLWSILK